LASHAIGSRGGDDPLLFQRALSMKSRLFALILVFLLALASFALLLDYSDRRDSITLAELIAPEKEGGDAAQSFREPARVVFAGEAWLADLGMESFFYGALGICGVLVALRAIFSALNIVGEGRAPKIPPKSRAESPQAVVTRSIHGVSAADDPGKYAGLPTWDKLGGEGRQPARKRSVLAILRARWMPHRYGLTRRLALSFIGVVAAFGLFTIFLVQFTLTASLRRHAIERARVTAVNVSDNAASYILKNNSPGLRALLRKLAVRPEVAYVVVQNRAGQIYSHSFSALPEEIQDEPALSTAQTQSLRSFRLGEGMVDELAVPVLDGQAGVVRLGVWRDEIAAEIDRTVQPIVKFLLLVVGCGVLAAVYLAWRINRPILRLVRAAQRISSGDLDAPSLGTEDRSEFGELSRALERMRSSIKAALLRLNDQR
jgi:HAMP domain-containing protein